MDRDEGTLADAIGAQGAFKLDSNRKVSIQYAVYKEGLKQVQAGTLAWKLFQEVFPPQVNMYTVQVIGDLEPNGNQWALIDRYFDGYRKQANGVRTNQGSTTNGNGTELVQLIRKVVATCNASTVKAVDEMSVHRAQLNRMPAARQPINQTWSYQAQPSYLRGGQQGNNDRG